MLLLLAGSGLLAYAPAAPRFAPMPVAHYDAPPLPPAASSALPSSRVSTSALRMAVMEAPPKVRSSAVTRRGGGQLISWYFNSISSTRLLSAQQEQQLAGMIIAGDKYEEMRDELEEALERKVTYDEWAEAAGVTKSELRKRMRRANSARDLMVAANSARPPPARFESFSSRNLAGLHLAPHPADGACPCSRSASGGLDRAPVPRAQCRRGWGALDGGPRPGGLARPAEGCRPLQPGAWPSLLNVCDVVDPHDRAARRRGPGAHDSAALWQVAHALQGQAHLRHPPAAARSQVSAPRISCPQAARPVPTGTLSPAPLPSPALFRPTEDELAAELDVPKPQLRVLMAHWHGVGSLEAPIVSRGPSTGQQGRQSTLLDAYRSRPQQQRTPEDSVEVRAHTHHPLTRTVVSRAPHLAASPLTPLPPLPVLSCSR